MVKYLLNDLFGSLSDATRRNIVERLLLGELTVSQLAEKYDMSLPAVSKHLRALESAGMVIKEKRGRQHFVRLTPAALNQATEHLRHYEAVLYNRLDSLGSYLQQKSTVPQKKTSSSPSADQQIIVMTQTLDVDLETAWRAYTDPAHIMRWWNSPGTQLLTVENDAQIGGRWCFTIHGADNNEYAIGGRYTAIEYPNRLEYTDGFGDPDESHPRAHVTITFEKTPDNKTLLTKTSRATPAVHQLNAAWLRMVGGG